MSDFPFRFDVLIPEIYLSFRFDSLIPDFELFFPSIHIYEWVEMRVAIELKERNLMMFVSRHTTISHKHARL